jgi:hypothetical protein
VIGCDREGFLEGGNCLFTAIRPGEQYPKIRQYNCRAWVDAQSFTKLAFRVARSAHLIENYAEQYSCRRAIGSFSNASLRDSFSLIEFSTLN